MLQQVFPCSETLPVRASDRVRPHVPLRPLEEFRVVGVFGAVGPSGISGDPRYFEFEEAGPAQVAKKPKGRVVPVPGSRRPLGR